MCKYIPTRSLCLTNEAGVRSSPYKRTDTQTPIVLFADPDLEKVLWKSGSCKRRGLLSTKPARGDPSEQNELRTRVLDPDSWVVLPAPLSSSCAIDRVQLTCLCLRLIAYKMGEQQYLHGVMAKIK